MTTRIVVVGAGVAGYTAVEFLRNSPINKEIKIIWIAPEPTFVYKPFLFDVVSMYRKLTDYIFSLEHYCERFYIEFVTGQVEKFLPLENGLILNNGKRVNYEYLIVATGETRMLEAQLQNTVVLLGNTETELQKVMAAIDTQYAAAKKQLSLLRKSMLSVVVTGHTIQSIITLFALYNYTESLRKKYDLRRNEISLAYVTPEKQLGGDIPLKLSDILEQYAKDHGVSVYIHQSIAKIEETKVTLNTGTVLESHVVVSEGEAHFAPVFAEAGIKANEFAGIQVNNYLQLEDFYNVYACGSVVTFYDWHKKERSWHSFNTAQAQAKLAASNVVAEIRGRNKDAYHAKTALELLPVNDQLAIGVYGDNVYFNNFMHYTRLFLATKYLWQLTMPE